MSQATTARDPFAMENNLQPRNTPDHPDTSASRRPKALLWLLHRVSGHSFMIILAIITGIITGLAAFLFKHMISGISSLFIPRIVEGSVNWWLILVPVGGILLTVFITRVVLHTDLTHVVAQMIDHIKHRNFRMRHNLVFSAIATGSLTLGMGGTSGAEGPIAATGAAIGNNLGQLLHLNNRRLMIMMAAGASAGISAIFSAPVGGIMFSLELLQVSISTLPVLTVTVAALTAYLTIMCCTGFTPDIAFMPTGAFEWSTLPAVLLLGLLCGVYSLYYTAICNRLDIFYRSISNPWMRGLIGALLLGGILCLFPSLFSTGYPVLTHVINGHPEALAKGSLLADIGISSLPLIAAGILLVKCLGVSATNSSGGVGGDFAPTLFAGAAAGYLFATLGSSLFGLHLPAGLFALYGMAGVMAGVIRAPLMSIFIVMEATAGYAYVLPICLVGLLSFMTVRGVHLTADDMPLIRHINWFHHNRSQS